MTQRLLLIYLAVVLGPLLVAAALFALRDRVSRRPSAHHNGDGHGGSDKLTQTVEEVRP